MASSSSTSEDWQRKVAKKRQDRQKAIPEAWALPLSLLDSLPRLSDLSKNPVNLISLDLPRRSGILSERELEITESHNVSSLLQGLASGHFTSSEVTLAFSKRAAIAQQLVGSKNHPWQLDNCEKSLTDRKDELFDGDIL